MRFIGDVHGQFDEYIKLAKESKYSFCVGDVGFKYDKLNALDPEHHFIIGGNHDNWDVNHSSDDYHERYHFQTKHFLGDFGVKSADGLDIFFVRGAWSIDKKYRKPGINWWPDEELDKLKREQALEFYKQIKPNLVVTHECPLSIVQFVTDPEFAFDLGHRESVIKTNTNMLLQEMLEFYAPEQWIFGHYHINFVRKVGKTTFRCLPELGIYEKVSSAD